MKKLLSFQNDKSKKLFVGAVILTVIIIIVVIILIIFKPWRQDDLSHLSGEAEAVMTTKAVVIDGIWDAKRYSDELYCPMGLDLLDGSLIAADSMCDRIQIMGGEKYTRIGRPGQYGLAYIDSGALIDGYRENAMFMKPSDVAVAPGGEIIVCDTGNHVIRKIDDTYVVTIAGGGVSGYAEGRENDALFHGPRSVAVGKDGLIYVADTMNHCIRRIDEGGNVTLYAGTPGQSGYYDGGSLEAKFFEPSGLVFSDDGGLYVADGANHCIRRIEDGMVSTVAGEPGKIDEDTGYPEGGYTDGDLASARFHFPRDIDLMPDGSILVADSMNHAVRQIKPDGVITLIGSGMSGQYYSSVENMKLTRPEGIRTDGESLYISDTMNNRIVVVPLTERILEGRPSREKLLSETGLSTTSKYAYKGDIRIYLDSQRVDMGRVQPWNTSECVYVPIRPFFEALGAEVVLDEQTDQLTITIAEYNTVLALDKDYFILKGIAVTTVDEIERLFPYTVEWFPEFSLIALRMPSDLAKRDSDV